MKFTSPMIIIFIGALLVAIGTFLQNKSSSEKSEKQAAKIDSLKYQNAELSKQLTNAALQINSNVTGTSDLPQVIIAMSKNPQDPKGIYNLDFSFLNLSEYALKGLELKLDVDGQHKEKNIQNLVAGAKTEKDLSVKFDSNKPGIMVNLHATWAAGNFTVTLIFENEGNIPSLYSGKLYNMINGDHLEIDKDSKHPVLYQDFVDHKRLNP